MLQYTIMHPNILLVLLCGFLTFALVYGATTVPPTPGPTPTPRPACNTLNEKCENCVQYPQCIYCYSADGKSGVCKDYPVSHLIPRTEDCDLSRSRWGTCVVNYKALLISMGTIAGLLLLSCGGCVLYCCCCRGPSGRQRRRWQREDQREETKKAERQMKQDQRKAERKAKNDEIRRKYGLKRDDEGQYHELEEDP